MKLWLGLTLKSSLKKSFFSTSSRPKNYFCSFLIAFKISNYKNRFKLCQVEPSPFESEKEESGRFRTGRWKLLICNYSIFKKNNLLFLKYYQIQNSSFKFEKKIEIPVKNNIQEYPSLLQTSCLLSKEKFFFSNQSDSKFQQTIEKKILENVYINQKTKNKNKWNWKLKIKNHTIE